VVSSPSGNISWKAKSGMARPVAGSRPKSR